jgi:hypothetical protein
MRRLVPLKLFILVFFMLRISFRGPRLKIKRAYKHINDLEIWVRHIAQSNIDAARAHKNIEPGNESHQIVVTRPRGYSSDVALIVGGFTISVQPWTFLQVMSSGSAATTRKKPE